MQTEHKEYINIQTKEVLDMEIVSSLPDNAMLKVRPDLWVQWNFKKNKELGLNIFKTTKGAKIQPWWICPNCESETNSKVLNKIRSKTCLYCAGQQVNHTNSLAYLNPVLASEWHPTKNGELTPNNVTPGKRDKMWWIGACGHEFEASINGRNGKGQSCPYCSGHRALKGFNDMWTTNPKLAELLLNPEDGYKYTRGSGQRVDWKCPKCGDILYNKTINNVKERGLNCKICADSLSFGEKIMYQFLKLNSIKFLYDQTISFSNGKRYDFIIIDNSMSLIIETHGRQHSEDTGFSKLDGRTLEEEIENDKYKERLAKENGIEHYIVIDTKKKEYDFVKDNIINSGIIELLNLDVEKFKEIDLSHSLVDECWKLWSINKMKKKDIAKEVGIDAGTVARYIKLRSQLERRDAS